MGGGEPFAHMPAGSSNTIPSPGRNYLRALRRHNTHPLAGGKAQGNYTVPHESRNRPVKGFIALLITSTFLCSCRYSFDKGDLSLINVYNTGDTLVFQGDNGSVGSIEITDKQFRYNGISEGYSGDPETCYIDYRTIPPGEPVLTTFGGPQGLQYSNEKGFLSATKWKRGEAAAIRMRYGGFAGKIPTDQPVEDGNDGG